jgi:cystathionine beta-lyase family protein involved in aluminum resistance
MKGCSSELLKLAETAEETLLQRFREIDACALVCTRRILQAFQEQRVSDACFGGTTGYGYDDVGRATLEKIYAQVFGAEAALVRVGLVNGTHAIATALFAVAEPGKKLLSVTGLPYDTLRTVIGISGDAHGTLKYYGVGYEQVELAADGGADLAAIRRAAADREVCAVTIQRSRGYGQRRALTVEEIGEICRAVREVNPEAWIVVDNCYGEFTQTLEPTHVGADLIAGSLIKNPGGGLAPAGGYVAGKRVLVERAAARMTTPGIGGECGATLGNNRLLFQGLFLAPHTVAQALKTAVFCAAMMEQLGIESSPAFDEKRSDIIQMVKLGSADRLKKFCLGIQSGAPVDSYVTPEPWAMPGYDCPVIMAAGSFIQGSSIELSADGPFQPPYTVYMQGGLTFESGRLGVMMAVSAMFDNKE